MIKAIPSHMGYFGLALWAFLGKMCGMVESEHPCSGALGGSSRPPNCHLQSWLCNSPEFIIWPDITAKLSLDLLLYPLQKQKWKLRSLGGLNLFQPFLFFQRIYFPLREKRKEKRSVTLTMGFFENILQRNYLFSSKWDILLALDVCFVIFYTYSLAEYCIAKQEHCFCLEFSGRN